MKRFLAMMVVFGLIAAGLIGAAKAKQRHKSKEERQIQQMKMMVHLVKAFYQDVCSNEEATIIAATLAVKDLGKKTDIDAPKYLHKILSKVKKKNLRNFVRFMIVDSYKDKKQPQEMVNELMNLVDENTKKGKAGHKAAKKAERKAERKAAKEAKKVEKKAKEKVVKEK